MLAAVLARVMCFLRGKIVNRGIQPFPPTEVAGREPRCQLQRFQRILSDDGRRSRASGRPCASVRPVAAEIHPCSTGTQHGEPEETGDNGK